MVPEKIKKLADDVISENKHLLKRLETEEEEVIKKSINTGESSMIENVEYIKNVPLGTSSTDPNYDSVAEWEYRTTSTNRNKVALATN